MIIIVEGIDRVGKTTLCNKIKEELKIKSFERTNFMKLSEFDNKNETDKMIQIVNVVNTLNENILFDRLYFSDYVYGTIERNYDSFEALKNFRTIDNFISEMDDVFLIYVLPVDIKWSSRKHGKDLSKYDKMFYNKFKESKIKNKYRCTYNSINEAVSFIKANKGKK